MACVIEAAAAALLPGPLLSTATASAVAGLADDSATPLMTELAGGATGGRRAARALQVCGPSATATGWRLSGSIGCTLGICAAQRILLAARAEDGADCGSRWTPSPGPGFAVEQQRGTDLSTDVGVLTSPTTPCRQSAALSGIATERARCIVVALAACASAGTVRRGVETASELHPHPRAVRQARRFVPGTAAQGGRTAGERRTGLGGRLGCGARASTSRIEQHRLAAASAALMAVGAGPDLMLDALLMFGAIGYTWEHDTHLYWRRATSLAASLGPRHAMGPRSR